MVKSEKEAIEQESPALGLSVENSVILSGLSLSVGGNIAAPIIRIWSWPKGLWKGSETVNAIYVEPGR
jgi:hypothetical protein